MFFVVAAIFSRKVATPALAGGARENAKFLSFFCDFAALREPSDEGYFGNHKFR